MRSILFLVISLTWALIRRVLRPPNPLMDMPTSFASSTVGSPNAACPLGHNAVIWNVQVMHHGQIIYRLFSYVQHLKTCGMVAWSILGDMPDV